MGRSRIRKGTLFWKRYQIFGCSLPSGRLDSGVPRVQASSIQLQRKSVRESGGRRTRLPFAASNAGSKPELNSGQAFAA